MLTECDEEGLKDLLVGHKITQIVGATLTLDDGTSLYFEGNEGCGGCSSGWYDLTKLNKVDNIITNVEITTADEGYDTYYRIYVYAEQPQLLAEFEGSDGNGCYGTGFTITVSKK